MSSPARILRECVNSKTYSDGARVVCGAWALPGLDYCEACAIKRRLIPKPDPCVRRGHHRWEIGSETCADCTARLE